MVLHQQLMGLTIFLLLANSMQAQFKPNLGSPFIQNFSKQEYNAGTQNWASAQDENGIIYLANNEGLLAYDGTSWEVFPLPNKTIVRSLGIQNDKIYVGGQDEVGFFKKNSIGLLEYHSIKPKIPLSNRTFTDVWGIIPDDKGAYFISEFSLFHFSNDTVKMHPNRGQFYFLGAADELIISQNKKGEVFIIQQEFEFETIGILSYQIISATKLGDQIIFGTEKEGLFYYQPGLGISPWPNQVDDFIKTHRLNRIEVLYDGSIALATALSGLLILNSQGYPLYWIDKKDGLQNNMVRSLFEDRDHNLWLGLDNGIDMLALADPISFLFPDGDLEGTSYAVKILENEIFIGTSNGLYKAPWHDYYNPLQSNSFFEKIPGTEGQVWGLNNINGDLFLGHNEGSFIVNSNSVEKLDINTGYWIFSNEVQTDSSIIAGSYLGLSQFKKDSKGNWQYEGHYNGFQESSRFLIKSSSGDYWISHPYRGLFKIKIDPQSKNIYPKSYGTDQGLPTETGNLAYQVWDEVLVSGEKGIFKYEPRLDQFQPYLPLNDILGADAVIRRIFKDQKQNLWYITDDKVGFINITDRGLNKEVSNFELKGIHDMMVGGFELIYPFDSSNVFLGAEKGMIHINPKKLFNQEFHFQTILNEIFAIGDTDSLLFLNQINHNNPDSILIRFPNKTNSFRFKYSSTNFSPFNKSQYQYKLEGYDQGWSGWTNTDIREYTNLPPGQYTFKVKSGIPDVYTSNTAHFTFYINHPWYANPFSYSIYGLLFIVTIAGLVWIPKQKFEKEKAILEREKEQEVAEQKAYAQQSKEELMVVKNEKLNAEINHKNKELASTTMHLLQKSELIQKLKTELDRITLSTKDLDAKKELKRIMGILRDDTQLDNEWEQFFVHFDQVHSDFFKRLRGKFPQLTAKDQKMCAYLRMNLSSKEIAPLMNISVRGVEISRYRLRKKMELDTEIHLNEFMMEF